MPREMRPRTVFRRSGVIVDLLSIDLAPRMSFVMTIEEDTQSGEKQLLFVRCEDTGLCQMRAGDEITFILHDQLNPGSVHQIEPELHLGCMKHSPSDWECELKKRFANMSSDVRNYIIDDIFKDKLFDESTDLCRLTIATFLLQKEIGRVANNSRRRSENLDDLERLNLSISGSLRHMEDPSSQESHETSSKGSSEIATLISRELLTWFLLLGRRSNEFFDLAIVIKDTLLSLNQKKNTDGNNNADHIWCVKGSITSAVDSVLRAHRFPEVALLYRVAFTFWIKDKSSALVEDALASKNIEYKDMQQHLQTLISDGNRLQEETRKMHCHISNKLIEAKDSHGEEMAAKLLTEALSSTKPVCDVRTPDSFSKFCFQDLYEEIRGAPYTSYVMCDIFRRSMAPTL
uniref:Nuclear pore complex protein n=1 Tax=Steinernema glaseri TaxID=37863 RepID=A0A1I7ZRK3_9BILA